MNEHQLSTKDEALLILEYLENEQMSKTFLNFLDESKHLHELRVRLYANDGNDADAHEFQKFFHLSKQLVAQSNGATSTLASKPSSDFLFDEDFLNDLISQTPPTDYPHDLPDTPTPSVLAQADHDEFNSTLSSIEQLFALQHEALSASSTDPAKNSPATQLSNAAPYTKCIVVTQDFLQSMYNQSSASTGPRVNSPAQIKRRRRRRLKVGKENNSHPRRLMPRTSVDQRSDK